MDSTNVFLYSDCRRWKRKDLRDGTGDARSKAMRVHVINFGTGMAGKRLTCVTAYANA
ncbi:hypothetical protein LR48_Vigan04g240200 [Vigna angularis]|uniref:Uncharacterized protein n=1 Tax=Phaseolus angularis TaxID=3914 RepID=A0A0L9UI21_PHAAN|nr:hypothetical protein LR48_Vigan04g240200 [Vigna angularis]